MIPGIMVEKFYDNFWDDDATYVRVTERFVSQSDFFYDEWMIDEYALATPRKSCVITFDSLWDVLTSMTSRIKKENEELEKNQPEFFIED